jgi:hypothetical protein
MAGIIGIADTVGLPGVRGEAAQTDNDGVQGFTNAPGRAGVIGVNNTAGVGVVGRSTSGDGVQGFAKHIDRAGVIGVNVAGVGVKGVSESHDGIEGFATHIDRAGVIGVNTGGVGVKGISTSHDGVEGFTQDANRAGVVGTNTGDGVGVLGQCDHNAGVRAVSTHGTGIVAQGGTFAAQLVGTVQVVGDLTVSGDIFLNGADYAEALSTTDPGVAPGTVVVLGSDGEIHPCGREYDTTVAGIVSGAGGVKAAIVLDRHDDSAHVALMGKVWCHADADAAPIRPGDLLTTSDTAGHCRRVTDTSRAFGAVVGKALTALPSGHGLVRVLVSPR